MTAACARHPDVAAVDTCQRCGAFVCGECTNIRDEDVYCPGCVPFLDRPPSPRAVHALRCALAAPILCAIGVLARGLLGQASIALTLAAPVVAFGVALAFVTRETLARARAEVPKRGKVFPIAWALVGVDFLLGVATLVVWRVG